MGAHRIPEDFWGEDLQSLTGQWDLLLNLHQFGNTVHFLVARAFVHLDSQHIT